MFQAFRTPDVGWDMIVNQNIFIEQLVPGMIVRKLTDAEMDAIREPFAEPIDPPAPFGGGPTRSPSEASRQTSTRS